MKLVYSMITALLVSFGIQANASWTCTYSCGSKEWQEPKVGTGYSQGQAMRQAQAQICTQYEGGYPKYFRGCVENYEPEPVQQWRCTYSCGSKEWQEPKVGYGWTQREAMRQAQWQTCTQYEGGYPKYFRGCEPAY